MTELSNIERSTPTGLGATRSAVGRGYLLVIPWELDATGGVSQVVENLGRELSANGWSPALLVQTWSAPTPQCSHIDNLPVVRWRMRPPWTAKDKWWAVALFLVTLPSAAWTCRVLARRYDCRIVNIHYPTSCALTWVLFRWLRCWRGAIIVSVHGREVRDALSGSDRIHRWLIRVSLETADLVIVCAKELAEDVRRLASRAADHVSVIPNGVSPQALMDHLNRHSSIPPELRGRKYILNIATFERKKSQDVLIDAFAQVAVAFPDVDLVLAGRKSPWLAEMRRRAQDRHIAERVHFYTDVPHMEIPAFISGASVFCLPSRSEGHPLAILEAAAFGVPVVATPVGGIPETIPDERYGLLVPVDDAPVLADALRLLLSNPVYAREIGGNLQRRVTERFTWAQTARQYAELARGLEIKGRR